MNLSISEAHQNEMCYAHYDGAPGVLVSGFVWVTAASVGYLIGIYQSVWTLLIGGALIYPISLVLTKMLGRPAKVSNGNALNQLAMASTVWLILCCLMAFGLFLLKQNLFFPAMMATIGCRYFVFASVFGRSIFWIFGGSLLLAANFSFLFALSPVIAAAIGGGIELFFGLFIFLRNASAQQVQA